MNRISIRLFCVLLAGLTCMSLSASAQKQLDIDDAVKRQRRVVKILRTTNKAQVNQYVPVAFELKHVNPYAVIRFIRRPIEAEEGNWWTFVHPDGDKGRLLINVPIWLVQPMRDLIQVIDRPDLTSSSGDLRAFPHMKHRNPADPGFLASVRQVMNPTARVIPDPATGSIYLEDAPSGTEEALKRISEALDVPTRQVLVQARVYDIDLSNDGALGLDYHAWKNGPGRNLFALGAYGEYCKTSRSGINGDSNGLGPQLVSPGVDTLGMPGRRIKSDGYNAAHFYDVPSAFFDFLVTKGKARILTSPQAMVRNTEAAVFDTGEEILFYRVQDGPADTAGVRPPGYLLDPYSESDAYPDNRTVTGATRPRTAPGSISTGVHLEVAPTIAEESINMDVLIDLVSQLGFDDRGIPMTSSRVVNTQIRATPGKEYIIGGLNRTRAVQSGSKIPVLGSIPVLGWLFGGEKTTAKQTQVAIVLQAEPVTDFSGVGDREAKVIESVSNEGMDQIEMPGAMQGFGMKPMDRTNR